MRQILIIAICLFLVLPLASAATYDSVTSMGELQDYDAENIYLVVPDTIYFGEEFSIIVGIEVNTTLSMSRNFFLDGTLEDPVLTGVDTPVGKTFAIYEWNITPWNNQNLILRGEMEETEFFRKDLFLNLKEKNIINSTIISSELIDLNKVDNTIITEARVALAGKNLQYSGIEFDQMIKLAKQSHDITKRVDKVLETYDDNTSKTKTIVTISINTKEFYEENSVDVIEIISKESVSEAKMIKSNPLAFVLVEDPIIMWHVTSNQAEIKYELENDVKVTGNTVMVSSLTTVNDKDQKFPWRIIAPLLVIPLIAGIIVFFARFEPKTKK